MAPRAQAGDSQAGPSPRAGFTIIEIMLVVAILGLMTQIVIPAFLQDIPESRLQAEARKIAAKLAFARSESRLESRSYGIEFDVERQRYHILLPPELRYGKDPPVRDYRNPDQPAMRWYDLPDRIVLAGLMVGPNQIEKPKAFKISFDGRGRSPHRVLLLAFDPGDGAKIGSKDELVFSIQVPPVTGAVRTVRGRVAYPEATDADF